jgi:hypothetical protein
VAVYIHEARGDHVPLSVYLPRCGDPPQVAYGLNSVADDAYIGLKPDVTRAVNDVPALEEYVVSQNQSPDTRWAGRR